MSVTSNVNQEKLRKIKAAEQVAFEKKQSRHRAFQKMQQKTSEAYEQLQAARAECQEAREEMNREYCALQKASSEYREVWSEYVQVCEANNPRIESLRAMADAEHNAMKKCFNQASREYKEGNKAAASLYATMGYDHRECRDRLNAEVSELCLQVKTAKQIAENEAPQVDSTAYRSAKEVFKAAKANQEAATERFKALQAELEHCRSEYHDALADHAALENEFRRQIGW